MESIFFDLYLQCNCTDLASAEEDQPIIQQESQQRSGLTPITCSSRCDNVHSQTEKLCRPPSTKHPNSGKFHFNIQLGGRGEGLVHMTAMNQLHKMMCISIKDCVESLPVQCFLFQCLGMCDRVYRFCHTTSSCLILLTLMETRRPLSIVVFFS